MSLAMARQATNNWLTKGVSDKFTTRTNNGVFPLMHPMSQSGQDVRDGRANIGQRFLYNTGQVTSLDDPDLNFYQTYNLKEVRPGRRAQTLVSNAIAAPATTNAGSAQTRWCSYV